MRKDGTGRSNGLPNLQMGLGGAMVLIGIAEVFLTSVGWLGLIFAAAGVAQVVAGALSRRPNQRIDRQEDASGTPS